jgi:DNA-binding transcriptional ArsR family regulator
MQLIGHGLVTRFNRQTFEKGVERERRFSVDDIEAVIDAPEFFRDGDAYFTGVWRQAETSEPSGQTAVLGALALVKTGLPAREIARRTDISLTEVESALKTLARHDVIQEEEDGRWRFTVELMRRWVLQREEE